ncbi:preprotein translocase subunit SecD [Actinobacillus pleuropneumoniae]|nr:preprotein translocase subunit SecD [Actinobacillus pleuropneumoniae]
MADITKSAVGKPMATLYSEFKDSGRKDANGKVILEKHEEVINVATINSRLGSQFQITGIDSPAEAQNLAVLLRSGALIAPIVIVEERTIGASLGADNVAKGMEAGMYGLILTIAFCLIYYKMFGSVCGNGSDGKYGADYRFNVINRCNTDYAGNCRYRTGGRYVGRCKRIDLRTY